MDYSPSGSSVHGILQARILEWVAISFSRLSPDPGIEPESPELQEDSILSESPSVYTNSESKTEKFCLNIKIYINTFHYSSEQ